MQDSNLRPMNRKSYAIPTVPPCHHILQAVLLLSVLDQLRALSLTYKYRTISSAVLALLGEETSGRW